MCNALGDDETGLEVIADRSSSAAFFICDAFNMTQARARARAHNTRGTAHTPTAHTLAHRGTHTACQHASMRAS